MQNKKKLRERLDAAIEALKRLEGGEMPTPEELSAAPQLDYWCFTDSLPWPELTGIVAGHPILPDGDQIVTSPLLWLSKDRTWARTVSRFYRLGLSLEELLATNQRN